MAAAPKKDLSEADSRALNAFVTGFTAATACADSFGRHVDDDAALCVAESFLGFEIGNEGATDVCKAKFDLDDDDTDRDRIKHVGVVILGLGSVGRAVLKIIQGNSAMYKAGLGCGFVIIGVADSTAMVCAQRSLRDGIPSMELNRLVASKAAGTPLKQWASTPPKASDASDSSTSIVPATVLLPQSSGSDSLEQLLRSADDCGAFSCVCVADCSASSETVDSLVLAKKCFGSAIVLANKKPLSGPYASTFQRLRSCGCGPKGLLHESTVGAGLPVISTLERLIYGGDRVLKVEGALSGTLGYLMTRLGEGIRFSDALAEAIAKGFTEPDPRDDLSGMDVARKALIVARLLGVKAEMSDISVESLYPQAMAPAKLSLADFMKQLPTLDSAMATRVADAKRIGQKLRYVASIVMGDSLDASSSRSPILRVGLQEVPQESALGTLAGTENMVCYTTAFYRPQPLVIRGFGAGVEVTASGVVADLAQAALRFCIT